MSVIANSLSRLFRRVLVGSVAVVVLLGGAVGVANAATPDDPGAPVVQGSSSSPVKSAPIGGTYSSDSAYADAASRSGRWAAIYVGPSSGHVGSKAGYSTADAANAAAKKQCGRSDCQRAITVKNACGALAQAPNGDLGIGGAQSFKLAKATAIRYSGSSRARIVAYACAGAYTA